MNTGRFKYSINAKDLLNLLLVSIQQPPLGLGTGTKSESQQQNIIYNLQEESESALALVIRIYVNNQSQQKCQ